MITKEQLRESLAVQEWLEEGEQKGEVKRMRTDLLAVVEIRFPKLDYTAAARRAIFTR